MSEENEDPKRGGIVYALSESSTVRLGLVLAICGGVWWASKTLSSLESSVTMLRQQLEYASDMQTARAETARVLMETLSRDVKDLSDRVRELEKKGARDQ